MMSKSRARPAWVSGLKRLAKSWIGLDLFLPEQISVARERHGSDYGGWWVHPDALGPKSVVYSFGVGDDISFDLSLIQKFGLRVHAFDPTPRSVAWVGRQQLPEHFEFHDFGLADFDGDAEFAPPAQAGHMSYSIRTGERPGAAASSSVRAGVRRLATIMRMLGHDEIDLLKMDIEGAEYAVVRDALESRVAIRQILVEFHHGHRGIAARRTHDAIQRLNAAGFRIFAVSRSGREVSLLRTATEDAARAPV